MGTDVGSKVTIFYSWQSDLPNATNRGFIEQALHKALKAIRAEEETVIEACVERDTMGVPGTPDIASTIFGKIEECQIFVGDVSIVTPSTDAGRKTPNPNVLLELGYAAKTLSWDNVICVFNTAFGRTEDLPFDLRLRRMCLYEATEGMESKAGERDRLASKLKAALQPILQRITQKFAEDAGPSLLTPEEAGARVKEYLDNDRNLPLHDLVMAQGNELAQRIVGEEFPVVLSSRLTVEVFKQRVERYAEISQTALAIIVAGCYYGDSPSGKPWIDLLQRVANPQSELNGLDTLIDLRRFPALLLLNGAGVAATAAERFDTLLALLTKPSIHNHRTRDDGPPWHLLSPYRIMTKDAANAMMGRELYVPLSQHFFKVLREPLRYYLPDDRGYQRCFDRFEYMRSLLEADLTGGPQTIGIFGWRRKYPEQDVTREIGEEAQVMGQKWPPLLAGWFDGKLDRFTAAKAVVDDFVARLGWD
jgi:hypothetical protein